MKSFLDKLRFGMADKAVVLQKEIKSKKNLIMFGYMIFMVCTALFANPFTPGSGDTYGLSTRMVEVLQILYSPWVKGILIFSLALACIGIVTGGRADEQMWKKLGVIGLGVALYLAAPKIANAIFKLDTNEFSGVDL